MGKINLNLTAIDIFSGAGGLSLGFEEAGFWVISAIEKDVYCSRTYRMNRRRWNTKLIHSDVSEVKFSEVLSEFGLKKGDIDILLCGAPCQGFSIANRRTRSMDNPQNHNFKYFIKVVKEICPRWILFENVSGIADFNKGEIIEIINIELDKQGYLCTWGIINSKDYGIPQMRRRFFLIGNRMQMKFSFPLLTHDQGKKSYTTVRDAISDLPILENGNNVELLPYRYNGSKLTEYQIELRKNWRKKYCTNNRVTRNNDLVIKRYKFIPPGGNWEDIPAQLMQNYKEKNNCHSGIYKRLNWDEPSIVISNFRKCMLIHPEQERGLSVREAARIQSFPDEYIFYGPLGSQQQQVADAVPPMLAKSIAIEIRKITKLNNE